MTTHTDSKSDSLPFKEHAEAVRRRVSVGLDDKPKSECPPHIAAIREAAGMKALTPHESIDNHVRQALAGLSESIGSRYSRERTRLEEFEIYHDAQRVALAEVNRFIDGLAENIRDGRGLILYGPVGTGKDHLLAAALFSAAAASLHCLWMSGQEFYGRMRDVMDTGEREAKVMNAWALPSILAISDPIPPRGQVSEWNTSQLYRLLDKRYRNCRSTWVSLNAASEQDADEKLSAPVFDRLRDGATIVRCFWPSYRERDKRRV